MNPNPNCYNTPDEDSVSSFDSAVVFTELPSPTDPPSPGPSIVKQSVGSFGVTSERDATGESFRELSH